MKKLALFLLLILHIFFSACIDLNDPSTYNGVITNVSQSTFIINGDATLCTKNYSIQSNYPLFIFNGTYTLDCNNSVFVGNGIGKGLVDSFDKISLLNCVFKNYGVGIEAFDSNNEKRTLYWTVHRNFSSLDDKAMRVIAAPDGFIYVAGYDEVPGKAEGKLVKIDKDGNLVWEVVDDSSTVKFNDLVFANDLIYVAGSYYNIYCNANVWLVEAYSKSGDLVHVWRGGSIQDSEAFGITADSDGNIYVVGYNQKIAGDKQLFIAKFDQNLNKLTDYYTNPSPGDDVFKDVAIDQYGNVYAVGYDSKPGNKEMIIFKLDKKLTYISFYANDDSSGDDAFNSVTIGQLGYIYAAGYGSRPGNKEERVIKFDSTLHPTLEYSNDLSSGDDFINDIAIDNKNQVHLVAFTRLNSDGDWRFEVLEKDFSVLFKTEADFYKVYNEPSGIAIDEEGADYIVGFSEVDKFDYQWDIQKYNQLNSLTNLFFDDIYIFNNKNLTFYSFTNSIATFKNLWLGYDEGGYEKTNSKIHWKDIKSSSRAASGYNIILQPDFVSLDDSNLTYLNTGAHVYINGCGLVYKKTGFPKTREEILGTGSFYEPSLNTCELGHVLKFSVDSFSGYATKDVCVDLYNISSYGGRVWNVSNTSFVLNSNITLCNKTYPTKSQFNFLIINGSYTLDCNGSKLIGSGLGKGILGTFSNTKVRNCIVKNFGTGVEIASSQLENLYSESNYKQTIKSGSTYATSIVVDQGNYFYMGGYGYSSSTSYDWYIRKLDSQGNEIWTWSETFSPSDDYLRDMLVDQEGNIYATGYFKNGAYKAGRVVKLSPEGNLIWDLVYDPAPDENDDFYAITVDQEGYIYVGGYDGTGSSDSWHLFKISKDGQIIWNKSVQYGTGNSEIWGLATDQEDNVYAAGYSAPSGDTEITVVKYYPNGTVIWNKTYNFAPGGFEMAIDIAVDNQNYVYIVGFDRAPGNNEMRLLKIDSNGNQIWTFSANPSSSTDRLESIAIDQNNYVYVGGLNYSNSEPKLDLIKFSPEGNIVDEWLRNYGSAEYLEDIAVDSMGRVGFVGEYYYDSKFNPFLNVFNNTKELTNNQIINSEFYSDKRMTFLALSNTTTSINTLTLGYNETVGNIFWSNLFNVDDVLIASYNNVVVDPMFVSLNTSDPYVSFLNQEANITLSGIENSSVFKDDKFAKSRERILDEGYLVNPSYLEYLPGNLVRFSSVSGFSGYTTKYTKCINLYNTSTFGTLVKNISNSSFFINYDVTLCKDTYTFDTIDELLIMNGSYTLDCNGSTLIGSGLGTGILNTFNNTIIKNCILENFGTELSSLNIPNKNYGELWSVNKNLSNYDRIYAIAIDQNGFVYAGGYDNIPGKFEWNLWKLDKYGNEIWDIKKDFDSNESEEIHDIAVGPEESIYVFGTSSYQGEDQWTLIKFDSDGNETWNFTTNPSSADDVPSAVAVDKFGNIYLGGSSYSANWEKEWRIIKLTKNKNLLWNITINISDKDDNLLDIGVDPYGDIILVGTDYLPGNDEWRVIKLDPDGNILWQYSQNPSSNYDEANSVVFDKLGNIYVGGFDSSAGNYGWRVIKLDRNGNLIWNWTQNPSSGYDRVFKMVIDQEDNLYVGGFDAIPGNGEFRIVKLDNEGNVIWNWTKDFSSTYDMIRSLVIDQEGCIYAAGYDRIPGNDEFRIVKLGATTEMNNVELYNISIFNDDTTYISLPNVSAKIVNLTIGHKPTYGIINWLNLNGVSGSLSSDFNIILSPYFVSLNSSEQGASYFNYSANITLYGYCDDVVHKKEGFPTTREEINTGPIVDPSYSYCSGNTYKFSTVNGFSGYALKFNGCVDLYNLSQEIIDNGIVKNISNTSFFINDNITLCTNNYTTNTLHNFLIINGSYTLDCNGSKLIGNGLGTGILSTHNNTLIKNCVLENFNIGLDLLNINESQLNSNGSLLLDMSGGNDEAYAVSVDSEGYFYVGGHDSIGGTENWNLQKISKEGIIIWNISESGGKVYDVDLDNEGNIYAVGYLYKNNDYYWKVQKLLKNGSVVWTFDKNYSPNLESANAIAIDQQNNIYVGGYDNTGGGYEWRLIKFDTSGNILWEYTKDISSGNDEINGLAVDQEGYIYAVGYDNSPGNKEWVVRKFDPQGSEVWTITQNPSSGEDEAFSVAVDSEGNVYVVGSDSIGGTKEWRIIKLSKEGNLIWNWTYTPDSSKPCEAYDIAIDQKNYLHVVGRYESQTQGGDWLIINIDKDGSILTNWTIDLSSGEDHAKSIDISPEGSLYVAGFSVASSGGQPDHQMVVIRFNSNLDMSGINVYNLSIYDIDSTYLSLFRSYANFSNLTIGYNETIGKMNWVNLNNVNGSLSSGYNVILDPEFVSMNTSVSDSVSFNQDANITILGDCLGAVFKKLGFPRSKEDIIENGSQVNPSYTSCSNNIYTFSTVSAFSGYSVKSYQCVDLYNISTYNGRVKSFLNNSFFVNQNITLCKKNYSTKNIHPFLITNISYIKIDCNGSRLIGPGLGIGILNTFSHVDIYNCILENFGTGVDLVSAPLMNLVENWFLDFNPSPNTEYPYALTIDQEGYIYEAGYADFGDAVFALTKVSENKTFIWNWTKNCSSGTEEFFALAIGNNGNIYAAGIDNIPGNSEWVLFKINRNGTEIWNYTYNPSSSSDYAYALTSDGEGAVYIGGTSSVAGSDVQWGIHKINTSDGSLIWKKEINPSLSGDILYALTTGIDGDIYAAGYDKSRGDAEWRVIRINKTNGNIEWAFSYNPSSSNDELRALAIDHKGYIYAGGSSRESGSSAWAILKLDPNGTLIWNKTFSSTGGDSIRALTVDKQGYVYAGGYIYNSGDYEWKISKIDGEGTVLDNWYYNTSSSSFEGVVGLASGPNDYIYALGYNNPSGDYSWGLVKLGELLYLSGIEIKNVSVYDYDSTLLALPNGSAYFDNFTIGYNGENGKINWGDIGWKSGVFFSDNNVILNPYFVSLNVSSPWLNQFNESANISLLECGQVFKKSGFPRSKEDIIENGSQVNPSYTSCSNNIYTFSTVSAFSGYATLAQLNLTIWINMTETTNFTNVGEPVNVTILVTSGGTPAENKTVVIKERDGSCVFSPYQSNGISIGLGQGITSSNGKVEFAVIPTGYSAPSSYNLTIEVLDDLGNPIASANLTLLNTNFVDPTYSPIIPNRNDISNMLTKLANVISKARDFVNNNRGEKIDVTITASSVTTSSNNLKVNIPTTFDISSYEQGTKIVFKEENGNLLFVAPQSNTVSIGKEIVYTDSNGKANITIVSTGYSSSNYNLTMEVYNSGGSLIDTKQFSVDTSTLNNYYDTGNAIYNYNDVSNILTKASNVLANARRWINY